MRDLLQWASASGGTAAATVAGSIWGAEHGASRIPGTARVALDLSSIIEEIADVLVLGQRACNLGRRLGPDPDELFEGSGTANMLWERLPGW